MKLPSKTLERRFFNQGYKYIIAVDEVGVGPLAGPVVVCAVGFTKNFYDKTHKKLRGLRDSKLLSAERREFYADKLLKEKELAWSLAFSKPKTIDKLNIYGATRLAMKRAVKRLRIANQNELRTIVLVDGRTKIGGLNIDQMPVVKGDRKVFAIACASIIAKVHRDKIMVRYAKKFPAYGFENHKGYGTKYHQACLMALGPCEIHRKSFGLKY